MKKKKRFSEIQRQTNQTRYEVDEQLRVKYQRTQSEAEDCENSRVSLPSNIFQLTVTSLITEGENKHCTMFLQQQQLLVCFANLNVYSVPHCIRSQYQHVARSRLAKQK